MDKTLTRLHSDVPGLDDVCGGGLIAGSSYIFQGRPGSGKTILANQIVFSHARQGHKVIYVTLLAESHDRLFQSLSTLAFFDGALVGRNLIYLSLFNTLRDEGLTALVHLLRSELVRHGATMLVLDGLLNARESSQTNLDVKTFVAELQGHAAFSGCTVLFLTSARIEESSPEHTMVDGVFQLEEHGAGSRTVRQIKVAKSRGSSAIGGIHLFEIDDSGISVYPRFEAMRGRPTDTTSHAGRISTGIGGLDERVGGGLPEASVTALVGPAGSGKTTFGLNFLRLATAERPALHFGFYESPDRLNRKAAALGIDCDSLIASGALEVIWHPMTESLLDKLAHELIAAVERTRAQRLFVDGLAGFERATVDPHRMVEFFAALGNQLRAVGVTTICTWEVKELSGPWVTNPSPEILSQLDNVIGMQHANIDGTVRRSVTVLKVRDSMFDPRSAEVEIAAGGFGLQVVGDLPQPGEAAGTRHRPR